MLANMSDTFFCGPNLMKQ